MIKTIDTKNAPAAVGPYSQAKLVNGFLYTSGQLPMYVDGTMPEGIETQTLASIANVKAILDEAGYTFEDVVKTTCFLSEIANFGTFNKIYEEYFVSKPARSCFAVKDLPKGALVEIEVIAYKD